jgi:hypothetical protein
LPLAGNIQDNNKNGNIISTVSRASNLNPIKKEFDRKVGGRVLISAKLRKKNTVLNNVSRSRSKINIWNAIWMRKGNLLN